MQKKTEIELEQAKIIKVTRTLIRLKHSLAADIEINDVLPDRLMDFQDSLQGGELKEIGDPTTMWELHDSLTK